MNDEKNSSQKEDFMNIFYLKKVQVKPLEQFKIPIDLVTRTAMNITLDEGGETLETKKVAIIPEGITTSDIIKKGLKADKFGYTGFKKLTLKPQNPDITADEIVAIGEKANLFKKDYKTVYKSPIDNHILTPKELSETTWHEYDVCLKDDNGSIGAKVITSHQEILIIPKKDGEVDISEIIKQGIEKCVQEFLDLPIIAVGKTDEEILKMDKNANLFECKTVIEGTGVFSDSKKSISLRESKKGNLNSEVNILVKNADTAIISKEFDYGLLSACISEKLNGNNHTTVARNYHLLGGGKILHPQMRQKILDSLKKLARIQVTINLEGETIKRGIVDINADKERKKMA